MEQATDQETMAAQERLLKKREALGVTTNPIRLMSSAQSEERIHGVLKTIYDNFPDCEHGSKRGFCEECREEAQRKNEERYQEQLKREEEERKAAKEREMTERFEHPERWLTEYKVPQKFLDASFQNFSGGGSVKQACESFPKKNIVLIGKTGCGKTHLAAATLRGMVVNGSISKARFTTVPRLLMEIRDSFKGEGGESERDIVERYSKYNALILDDLGADRATEWAIETLYLIIDGRDSNLKPTFITTNLTIPEIEQHYGARIASRIAGMNIVTIDMPDYRKKRG